MALEIIFNKISGFLENTNKNITNLNYILNDLESTDLDPYRDKIVFNKENYKRNLLLSNKYLDCFVICWEPHQESPIHDHPEKGCIFKILQGQIQEDTFKDKKHISSRLLKKDNISSIDNKKGKHCMKCMFQKCISVHFYAPSGYYNI